jgi:hypothetical protein
MRCDSTGEPTGRLVRIILQSSSFREGFLLLPLAHNMAIDWQQSNQVINKTNETVFKNYNTNGGFSVTDSDIF